MQVMAHNLARWTARIGLGEQLVTTKTLRRRFFSMTGRLTRSARRLTLHLPQRWPWKTSSVAPWHGCEQFHSQPDGTAGVNADGDLTRPPDYPTASQTCARLVPERLLLHATLTISPSIATAGRHHRRGVATSRRPHPLYWNQARPVRLPLPIILCVIATAHRFGGFGLTPLPGTLLPGCQRQRPPLRWIWV